MFRDSRGLRHVENLMNEQNRMAMIESFTILHPDTLRLNCYDLLNNYLFKYVT